jgi:Uma2 family endonuclease
MIAVQQSPRHAPATVYLHEDAYLQREIEALERTEYIAGVLYPRWEMMAGGRLKHNVMCVNISSGLNTRLRGKGCRTLSSDQRIINPRTPAYLYPDVTVVCGKPEIVKHQTLVNPTLLVEVTSPKTVNYDRTTKLVIYDTIPSVQEYCIVSHTAQEVMLFRRDSVGKLAFVEIATERVKLESVGCVLDVAEIYFDTDFGDLDEMLENDDNNDDLL